MKSLGSKTAGFLFVAAAFLSGVSLLGKPLLLQRFIHLPVPALLAGLALALCLPLFWRRFLPYSRFLGPAFLLALALVFLAVFPRVHGLHKEGRGSDQPDCVIVVSHRLAHGLWPYDRASLYSRNALSCGPGWVALQSPVTELAGYKWSLLLCWLAAVGVMIVTAGRDLTFGVLALTALSPGTWITAANGSDFLTFGTLLVAFLLAISGTPARATSRSLPRKLLLVVFLGLLIQFRIPTLILPGFLVRQIGRGPAIAAWALGTFSQAAFLLWNTRAYIDDGPLHVAAKLMKTGVLSYSPSTAAAELVLCSAIGMAVVALLSERLHHEYAILIYLWIVFFLPAVQDFILKYQHMPGFASALELWEGYTWMVAAVPLGALLVVRSRLLSPPHTQTWAVPGASA